MRKRKLDSMSLRVKPHQIPATSPQHPRWKLNALEVEMRELHLVPLDPEEQRVRSNEALYRLALARKLIAGLPRLPGN